MLWSLDELIDQYAPKMREILPKGDLKQLSDGGWKDVSVYDMDSG